jgi:uncharacterized integral membrane protein
VEGQRPASQRRDIPWLVIVFGILALYAILLVVLNSDQVEVSFVFFTAEISKLVLIVLCLGIGFTIGFLFDRIRAHRRSRSES